MSDLVIPGGIIPSNLHLGPSMKAAMVTSDMYDIARRVQEVDLNLHIFLLTKEDDPRYAYVITEHCPDGEERMVFKVKDLDGRVIDKLRYLMAKPLAERYAELEKENYRFEQEQKEAQLDDLYERVGRPMWTELEKCNFITRPQSYPKLGVTAHGRRAR